MNQTTDNAFSALLSDFIRQVVREAVREEMLQQNAGKARKLYANFSLQNRIK